MLTPRFKLSQTDEFLTVTIYAPFTHIDNTEIFMDECDFRFFSKPYYLRLHLPGPVVESEAATGSWDAESNSFVVNCPKANIGENFQGLDMLTELLTPKGESNVKNNIEVINEDSSDTECDEDDIEWYFEQNLPTDEDSSSSNSSNINGYGFAFRHTGVYTRLLAEFGEILDLKNPDEMSQEERDDLRKSKESDDFNDDHYLSDMYDNIDDVHQCLSYKSPFHDCFVKSEPDILNPLVDPTHPCLAFSQAEQEQLIALPNKRILLSPAVRPSVYLGLADLLYGYSYSLRVLGEECVETGWCSSKLSASLSCLAKFSTPKQLVLSGLRRALCYPLYRHWDIAVATWKDVILLLRIGKSACLKSLLSIITAFNSTPGNYVFNQLYVNDYAVWIQTLSDSNLQSLADAIEKTLKIINKHELDLDIPELEKAANLILEEEKQLTVDKLTSDIGRVKICQANDSDDDSDSESSDDDSSSDGSTSEASDDS